MSRLFSGLLALLALLALGACEIPQGKVAQGQLYMSGEAKYDAFFRDVHAVQVWVAEWGDDRKATRRPLISILDLTPDAPDVTISQATHEKVQGLVHEGGGIRLDTVVDDAHVVATGDVKHDAGLFRAIEETAAGELQRAKKLDTMLPKLDELMKLGRSLEPHLIEAFQKQGPAKASEVKSELVASHNILASTSTKARRTMRECDDFVSDLQRAIAAGSQNSGHRVRHEEDDRSDKADKVDKGDKDKPEKADKTDKADKPRKSDAEPKPVAPKPAAKPAAPPAAPKPAAKPAAPPVVAAPPPAPAPPAAKPAAPPAVVAAPPPAPKPAPKPAESEVFNP